MDNCLLLPVRAGRNTDPRDRWMERRISAYQRSRSNFERLLGVCIVAPNGDAERWLRVFSFGGGWQSHGVLALMAQGKVQYDALIFANVGDDSENPDTLAYLKRWTIPYCQRHGIPFIEVRKQRFGVDETLLEAIYRDNRSVPIPVYMAGGQPGNRTCTEKWKIEVIDRWIRDHGYQRAVIGLGISVDEFARARDTQWHNEAESLDPAHPRKRPKKFGFLKQREYPLIALRLRRSDCAGLIESIGLPEPPPSACWFCPFTRRSTWIDRKRNDPALFQKAINVEEQVNDKRGRDPCDHVYLHRDVRPLAQAVSDQLSLFDIEETSCESGHCMI